MLVTTTEYERIVAQAEREYPNECCGVVLYKAAAREDRLFLAFRNIQDELHAREPERYSRTARTAYAIGVNDYMRLDGEVEKGYRPVIYHSHIDAGAYFSETDKRIALQGGGEPLYPDAVYVVVSVVKGKVADAKAFAWDPARDDFLEVPFQRSLP
jgi:adenylyltransferase/sulfurtransferase